MKLSYGEYEWFVCPATIVQADKGSHYALRVYCDFITQDDDVMKISSSHLLYFKKVFKSYKEAVKFWEEFAQKNDIKNFKVAVEYIEKPKIEKAKVIEESAPVDEKHEGFDKTESYIEEMVGETEELEQKPKKVVKRLSKTEKKATKGFGKKIKEALGE